MFCSIATRWKRPISTEKNREVFDGTGPEPPPNVPPAASCSPRLDVAECVLLGGSCLAVEGAAAGLPIAMPPICSRNRMKWPPS